MKTRLPLALFLSIAMVFGHTNATYAKSDLKHDLEAHNLTAFSETEENNQGQGYFDDVAIAVAMGILWGSQNKFSNIGRGMVIGFALSCLDSVATRLGIYNQRYLAHSLLGASFLNSFGFSQTATLISSLPSALGSTPLSNILGPMVGVVISQGFIPIIGLQLRF